MAEKLFGLLGEHLGHSFSVPIHQKLGNSGYRLIELPPDAVKDFIRSKSFCGINVTIPYKKMIMDYCDIIDRNALRIGSVNTVVRREDGLIYAYNTDKYGFEYMLQAANISLSGKKVLILGSGGTSLTAQAVAADANAERITVLSRSGQTTYADLPKYLDSHVIINTTPVGMYPQNQNDLVFPEQFPNCSGVVDVIYNPQRTSLLMRAEALEIPNTNGLPMLVAQAEASEELFFSSNIDDSCINVINNNLQYDLTNIVLVGMPGSGKSTIGKVLAQLSGRQCIDIDEEIVKESKMDITEIFAAEGEAGFRIRESAAISLFGKESSKIIVCGGGAVLNEENYYALKQNGRIYYICRDIEQLAMQGRPLSKDIMALKEIFNKREPLYQKFADIIVENSSTIETVAEQIWEEYRENFCH